VGRKKEDSAGETMLLPQRAFLIKANREQASLAPFDSPLPRGIPAETNEISTPSESIDRRTHSASVPLVSSHLADISSRLSFCGRIARRSIHFFPQRVPEQFAKTRGISAIATRIGARFLLRFHRLQLKRGVLPMQHTLVLAVT